MKKSGVFRLAMLLFVFIGCIAATNQGAKQVPGAITGQVLGENGKPVAFGVVAFFSEENGPLMDQGVIRRVPELVVRIEAEGRFKAKLPAGRYYLGFLQRDRGRGPGPPRPGEKHFFAMDAGKQLKVFAVETGQSIDAGVVSGGAAPDSALEPARYFTVQGRVSYEDGRPFAGAYVTAKKNLTSPRPLFISGPTDAAGSYSLKLPPGETFILVALEDLRGGRPRTGSHVGSFGGKSPVPTEARRNPPPAIGPTEGYAAGQPVSGKAGEVRTGLDITAYKIVDPEQVRKEMLEKAGVQGFPEQAPPAKPGKK